MTTEEIKNLPQGENSLEVFVSQGQKQAQWQQMEQLLHGTKDRLGKGIDEGIFETVVALNVLGINTSQSCEGHIDRGQAAPWVHIQAPGIEPLEQEYRRMLKAKRQEERTKPRDQLTRLSHEPDEIQQTRDEILKHNLEERKKAMGFLDEFYRERRVPYDRMLITRSIGLGVTRLQSQGAEFQEIASPDERQRKLLEYQQEMQAFGAFLKGKHFAG
jgi:hypothetical protein